MEETHIIGDDGRTYQIKRQGDRAEAVVIQAATRKSPASKSTKKKAPASKSPKKKAPVSKKKPVSKSTKKKAPASKRRVELPSPPAPAAIGMVAPLQISSFREGRVH